MNEGDLSSPEATISGYIECLKKGDLSGIKARYYPETIQYTLRGPSVIREYDITNKRTFTQKEVDNWNKVASRPRAQVGDVQMEVREIIQDSTWMFSYVLRNINDGWKLISHSGWSMD